MPTFRIVCLFSVVYNYKLCRPSGIHNLYVSLRKVKIISPDSPILFNILVSLSNMFHIFSYIFLTVFLTRDDS